MSEGKRRFLPLVPPPLRTEEEEEEKLPVCMGMEGEGEKEGLFGFWPTMPCGLRRSKEKKKNRIGGGDYGANFTNKFSPDFQYKTKAKNGNNFKQNNI